MHKIKKTLETWMDNKSINNAMLFRLNTFSHMAKQANELEEFESEDWECLKWRAMFKYNLVRNIGKHLKGEERDRAIKEVEKAALWLEQYGGAMKVPVWQIIYNQR